MIKRIAYTMYPVVDMVRARRFYEEDLGLVMTSDYGPGQWVEYDPGGCFALTTMVPVRPSADIGGAVAFEVDDVVTLTNELKRKGVIVTQDVRDTPVCQMSVVLDPEGNAVILHQLKRPS